MKILALLSLLLLGASPIPRVEEAVPASRQTVPRELCKLRGAVFVTDNPQEAHFRVFVEEYESSADLVVYSEENRLFADQPGIWHFTTKPAFADFKIYLTDTRAFSDFSIAYTDVASFAGCR